MGDECRVSDYDQTWVTDYVSYFVSHFFLFFERGRRGCDHMVVGFTTTYAISAYHHLRCEFDSCSGEVYSLQDYVIKFVSDLRQESCFLWLLRIPSPRKLTATI